MAEADGRRRLGLEDIAERAAVLRDLCRRDGDTEHEEAAARVAADAAIELAFLGGQDGNQHG